MFGYIVEIDSKCVESVFPEEQFGSWSESFVNRFNRIFKDSGDFPDVVSVEEFNVGDSVIVVWAQWSSGDSFGYADGGCVEALAVFSNIDDAFGLKHAMVEHIKKNDDSGYNFVASTGQVFKADHTPWYGYFEHLDAINIEHVTLE